jgi:carboxyl-terminal processing protease
MLRSHRSLLVAPVAVVAITAIAGTAYVAGAAGAAGPTEAPGRPSAAAASSSGGVLDEVANAIAAKSARPVDRTALDRAAVAGMLGVLDDRWAAYYPRSDYAQFQDALDGSYTGVGLWLRRDDAGRLLVASVAPTSAAAAAEVRAGDEVTDVAGRATRGRDVADVAGPLRGDAGSTVDVGVARGEARRVVTLRRDRVLSADVRVDAPAPGVARVRVASFSHGVGAQVRAAIAGTGNQHPGGVILDLRADPGGLLGEAVDTASAFLDGGPVVTYDRRDAPPQLLAAATGGDAATPLVVLVDGATASAAEVVAGALQDLGRAVVVGAPTFGKGSVQEPVTLADGSAVELTVGRYLIPSGRSLDGVGLQPDVAVPAGSPDEIAIRRSLDVLAGLR